MSFQVYSGDIEFDSSSSFANSTRSNVSQFSKTSSDKETSWFKSLKRNLSSKRRGKMAKSGGNISSDSSLETAPRLIKSEWDICGEETGDQGDTIDHR